MPFVVLQHEERAHEKDRQAECESPRHFLVEGDGGEENRDELDIVIIWQGGGFGGLKGGVRYLFGRYSVLVIHHFTLDSRSNGER